MCVLELEAEGGGRKWEGGLDKAGLSGENRCSSPVRQFASSPVRQFASSPVLVGGGHGGGRMVLG